MKLQRIKRNVILTVLLLATLLTGCAAGEVEVVWTSNLSDSTVFRIQDKDCEVSEAKVVLLNYKNMYESIYGEGIWSQTHNNQTMEDYMKDVTITQLAKMKSMVLLAREQEIALSSEEQELARKAAGKYYQSLTSEEKEYLNISQTTLENLYNDMAIATKLYTMLTGGLNEEVSDDDARVMSVMQIIVEDEEIAKEVSLKLEEGQEFESLAASYSSAPALESNLYKQKVSEAISDGVATLGDGDISECITDDGKYYFIKVIKKINRDLTEENKETILRERAADAFDTVYEDFISNLSSTFHRTVWDSVTIVDADRLKTCSIFEIFEEYCGRLKQN